MILALFCRNSRSIPNTGLTLERFLNEQNQNQTKIAQEHGRHQDMMDSCKNSTKIARVVQSCKYKLWDTK